MAKPNKSTTKVAAIRQIVSGGQTGVDRAALDAALEAGVAIGGWCPRGRRSEAGSIPTRYPLQETESRSYAVRTEWNVRDSDGTLIIVLDEISSGTKLTLSSAKKQSKPVRLIRLRPQPRRSLFSDEDSLNEQLDDVFTWLRRHNIRVLNIAGPRGSSNRAVYRDAKQFVSCILSRANEGG